jgi:hypothetical protein
LITRVAKAIISIAMPMTVVAKSGFNCVTSFCAQDCAAMPAGRGAAMRYAGELAY